MTIFVDTGSGSQIEPLPPRLDYAEVRLYDAEDNLVATGSNSAAGEAAALLAVQLPTDGTYRLEVSAPTTQPGSTGNYLLSVWDATVDVAPTSFGEHYFGQIETAYSVDLWTFSAQENQQVQFDLINASNPYIKFTLSGPEGWVGFDSLGEDSSLITLPHSGGYVLEAYSIGNLGGSYAFSVEETSLTELTLGTSHLGTFVGGGQAQLFHVAVPEQGNLIVSLDDTSNVNRNELYVKRGAPPTRSNYGYRFTAPASADQEILMSVVPPGDWYILVYSEATYEPGDYSLAVTTEDVFIKRVTPHYHGDSEDAVLTLTGLGFGAGTTVELVAADGTSYAGTLGDMTTSTRLTATFAAGSVPPGVYSVRTSTPGSDPAFATDAFEMISGGEALLETNLVLPNFVGYHLLATIYVEYANTGTVSMPAPVLVLKSSPATMLTLDQSRRVAGVFGSAQPDGFSDTVQFLASGDTPGILNPGESFRVPVYYAGQLRPWGQDSIDFNLEYLTVEDTQLMDWDAVKEETRLTIVTTEAWDTLWLNLVDQVGTTRGDYVRMLNENARYLAELGQTVIDLDYLWWFEIQQAYGFHQVELVESVADPRLITPGLPLTLDRVYSGCILGRNDITPFGRGWFDSWDTSLEVHGDGTVEVTTAGGYHRRFQPDVRGGYFSQVGDHATLEALPEDAFLLREPDGVATCYRANGQLEYWEDTNGNRITAGFTDGRLSNLTHSSGQWLELFYNNNDFISMVTDSAGRTTTFGYDGDHLTSVVDPDGQTTEYVYETSSDPRTNHALLSKFISRPETGSIATTRTVD